ncbi:MAG: VOC family protein [Pseudomonadales bacterium]
MIDHFMYGVPDLNSGLRWAREAFGVQPAIGGSHPGLGTCNALLSLGDTYLELIAPDPDQPRADNLGGRLASLSSGALITWAVRADLDEAKRQLDAAGIGMAGPVPTARTTPDGHRLDWLLGFPRGHAFGVLMPFFIDWLDCLHPGATNPVGGSLRRFVVRTPQAPRLRSTLGDLAEGVTFDTGEPTMLLDIESLDGRLLTLSATTESLAFSRVF